MEDVSECRGKSRRAAIRLTEHDLFENVREPGEARCAVHLRRLDEAALNSVEAWICRIHEFCPRTDNNTEQPMTQDVLQEEFIKLRDEAIWLRQTVNTFNYLFDSGSDTEQILKESACLFFGDLNTMMHEYTILVVCRLTGPARSAGKSNLSTQRFTMLLKDRGCLTPEIESLDAKLRAYGELLKPARDKIIAHSDLEVHVNSTVLGGHSEQAMVEFLEDLQGYFDSVGNVIGVGPSDFRHMPGAGDVIDLVARLKKANGAGRD